MPPYRVYWQAPPQRPRAPWQLKAAGLILLLLVVAPHARSVGRFLAEMNHAGPTISLGAGPTTAAGTRARPAARAQPTALPAQPAVAFAQAQLGKPYVWGGNGPRVFDCSGLAYQAWVHAGLAWPDMTAAEQYAWLARRGAAVTGKLQPGDLVFYAHDPGDADTIHHVALYAGGGRMIEAPRSGAAVTLAALRDGYRAARPGLVG
jgi:cell wall-associated NlpC family hydrolase